MSKTSPESAAARIAELSALRPSLAIVLGTGFADGLNLLTNGIEIPYRQLPGFRPTAVPGHAGKLLLGTIANQPVLVLAGRSHYYEGHEMSQVTFAIRVLAACGVRDVLLTNAAGGIHPRLRPGNFMIFQDHINFMGANPLRGECPEGMDRFVDLSRVYDEQLSNTLRRAARRCGVQARLGIYLAVSGPSYETPAEIRAFRRLGADAVGMSTVPEAIVARQCGLRVAGLSCITNRAAGLGRDGLSHAEVLKTAGRVRESAGKLLSQFCIQYRPEAQVSH